MSPDRSSAGDPARTLSLLWRLPSTSRRGPRPGRSVDAVVDAAIGLGDDDGLDAVTMRRVAELVGTAPMTLYTYVPGKAELLDLMLDTVYARMPRTDTAGQPWRDRAAAVAGENRVLFAAHPWAADISTGRPPLGPGQMAKYEHELRALDGLGLTDVDLDAALAHLLAFVRSHASDTAATLAARRASRMDDREWWEVNAPLLARVFDPSTYPTAARVGTAAGEAHGSAWDTEHAWTFGLTTVLDGLDALIRRRNPGG
ncbi:TetR/AcrR family transcriptional regulator [Pseudonocardia charpentierae]|uniref:TetR/AcrR family transcriptional regulator n=1 Tax=Pseudonocardia charpentierae TaxID=3075545 RepID=A0ABU2NES3_9PSEU|nr:TetR/AcrR family transcriptional regulator [Pseudonocardia sp. DSM 45834]MDT0352451.1 TetR/AcrR family transcriptional regulator [Pseudonocardia sp. DSM 45834]